MDVVGDGVPDGPETFSRVLVGATAASVDPAADRANATVVGPEPMPPSVAVSGPPPDDDPGSVLL